MWITIAKILGAIILFVIAVKVVMYTFFIVLFFLVNIRKRLVEYCYCRKQSASPWLYVIWDGFWIYELSSNFFIGNKLSGFDIVKSFIKNGYYNDIFIYIMMAVPFLILLFKARKYFIPVLFIKIVCIPLDIIYFIYSFFDDEEEFKPQRNKEEISYNREIRYTPSNSNTAHKFRSYSGNKKESLHKEEPITSDFGEYKEKQYDGRFDNENTYIPEKYKDQTAMRESADTYTHVKVDGEDYYVPGDSAAFGVDSPDSSDRDSDYAPFG